MASSVTSRLASMRAFLKIIGGYSLLCDTTAIVAVITGAALENPIVSLVFAAITLVLVLSPPVMHLLGHDMKAIGMASEVVGAYTNARILLVLTAVVLRQDLNVLGWEDLACLVLALLIMMERGVRRRVSASQPVAANLPGGDLPIPSARIRTWMFWLNTFGLVMMLVAAPLGRAIWPVILVIPVATVLTIIVVAQMTRYSLARSRFEASLPKVLKKLAPKFAFHWQAPGGTAYQAAMWLPYLDRIGEPYIVIVRTQVNLEEVSKMTDAPVILRTDLSSLDSILAPSLTTVFYCNTAVRNSHMIRFPQLTHIQLNHGDSDKIASASPVFRQYDKNFVAGQAAIDRFTKHRVLTRSDQFVLVGRPQLEGVQPERAPIGTLKSKTVLYAPTWSGFYEDSDYSSLVVGPQIVESLLARGVTVVFRPHPYARKHPANTAACAAIIAMLEADAKTSRRTHVFGEAAEKAMSVVDCFNAADAMVSDVSSVVSDFLFSGKPFAMASVSAHGDEFVDEFPLARAAYVFDVVDGEPVGMDEAFDDLLGADTNRAQRHALRSHYLGDAMAETSAQPFLEAARHYVRGEMVNA